MKVTSLITIVAALSVSTSTLAAGNPASLRASADRALLREQFCDAAFLYARLDEQTPKADIAILAATATAQGGDRAGAITMLEGFDARFPGDPLSSEVQKRLQAIRTAVTKAGPGTACAIPRPECGNGLIETGETCDDGNRAGGDSCPASCVEAVVAPVVAAVPAPAAVAPTPTPAPASTVPAWATSAPAKTEPTPAPAPAAVVEPAPAPVVEQAPEPAPVVEPARSTVVEPTRDDDDDDDDIVEPPPAATGPGAPIAGIILSSVGGLAAVGGGVAVAVGLMPFISYLGGGDGQAAAAAKYESAADAFERRQAAGDAADARAALERDASAWNNQGRWVALAGGGALVVGVGLLVGGIIAISNNGAAAEEAEDTNDIKDNDADHDDDEDR